MCCFNVQMVNLKCLITNLVDFPSFFGKLLHMFFFCIFLNFVPKKNSQFQSFSHQIVLISDYLVESMPVVVLALPFFLISHQEFLDNNNFVMNQMHKHASRSRSPRVTLKKKRNKQHSKDQVVCSARQSHNKNLRTNSGPLMLNAVIDEALFIRKRVEQILAFNDFCQNYGISKPRTARPTVKNEDPLETDIDLLGHKIDNMEKLISQQRKMNDELRKKLQSQQFASEPSLRQIGKFTKPLSKGVLSTNRDTDHLTTSRISEDVTLKNRNLQCRSDNASYRKSLDSSNRDPFLKKQSQKACTQNTTMHQQQLQILNEQFENLITRQGNSVSNAERAQIRTQLIQVSRRINQLTQPKTRTYHL